MIPHRVPRPWPGSRATATRLPSSARGVLLGILVVAAGIGASCAPHESRPPAPGGGEVLLSSSEVGAIARILRAEDRRAWSADTFAPLYEGAVDEVRSRAVLAAGRIGDTAATPFLLRALDSDASPSVRANAAFALGILGDSTSEVTHALSAALADGWMAASPSAAAPAIEAIAALGRIGGDHASATLHDVLRRGRALDTDAHRLIAAEALLSVWKLAGGAQDVDAAVPYLEAADPEIRWRAAYALMRGGQPAALEHLLAHATDGDHQVRAYVARALTSRGVDSARVADAALRHLTAALRDPHPHVRVNAVRSLGSYAERAPLDPIVALLDDPVPSVALAASDALGALGIRAAGPLRQAFEASRQPLAVRAAFLATLAAIDPQPAGEILARWATGGQPARYFAARALASLRADIALALAPGLAADPDTRVAIAALSSAAAHAVADSGGLALRDQARQLLRTALTSPDVPRRAAATHLLLELAEASNAPHLVRAFRRSVADMKGRPGSRRHAVAREGALAALTTLDRLRKDDDLSAPDRATLAAALDELFAGPRPDDPWIRRGAAELGVAWGEPPQVAAAEDIGFYQNIVRRYIAAPLAGKRRPRAIVETAHGPVVLELLGTEAPLTVHNFITLAEAGFFNGGVWHRVIPNFVLQDGAPGGYASGGPGWTLRDELNRVRYGRGVLGMALSGPDTGGSQWFITHSPQPHLDGGYTVFGRVIEGMEAADAVLQGEAIPSIRIVL